MKIELKATGDCYPKDVCLYGIGYDEKAVIRLHPQPAISPSRIPSGTIIRRQAKRAPKKQRMKSWNAAVETVRSPCSTSLRSPIFRSGKSTRITTSEWDETAIRKTGNKNSGVREPLKQTASRTPEKSNRFMRLRRQRKPIIDCIPPDADCSPQSRYRLRSAEHHLSFIWTCGT